MQVTVTTDFALKPDCYCNESTKKIEWTNSSDRKWLMNHLHWAMNNDRFVGIRPNPTEPN